MPSFRKCLFLHSGDNCGGWGAQEPKSLIRNPVHVRSRRNRMWRNNRWRHHMQGRVASRQVRQRNVACRIWYSSTFGKLGERASRIRSQVERETGCEGTS